MLDCVWNFTFAVFADSWAILSCLWFCNAVDCEMEVRAVFCSRKLLCQQFWPTNLLYRLDRIRFCVYMCVCDTRHCCFLLQCVFAEKCVASLYRIRNDLTSHPVYIWIHGRLRVCTWIQKWVARKVSCLYTNRKSFQLTGCCGLHEH